MRMYPVQTIESQDAKKSTLCFGCLSSNRKLRPLGEYYNIFHQLIDDDTYLMQQSDILLCWECRGALRKAVLFKEKVAQAQSMLSFYHLDPTISPEPLTTFTVATCDSVCTLTMAMEKTSNCCPDLIIKPVKFEKEEKTDLCEPIEKKDDYVLNEAVDDNDWYEERLEDDEERLDDNEERLDDEEERLDDEDERLDDEEERLDDDIDDSDKILEMMLKTRQQKNRKHKKLKRNNRKKKNDEEDPDYIPPETEEKPNKIKKLDKPIKILNSDKLIVTKNNEERDFSKDYYYIGLQNCQEVSKHTKIITIDPNELSHYMERDRNSELFRNTKYKCEKCVETFTKLKFRKHMILHTQTPQRKLVCNVCGQAYGDKLAQASHLHTHTYVRECLACGIRICSRNLMIEHLKIHRIRVQCTDCKETFRTKNNFLKHYRAVHTPCICDYCGRKTLYKRKMERHIRISHGEPRYCEQCNKSFKNFENHLKIRHTTHRTEEAFCVECNIQFINIYAYKQHLQTTVAHNAKNYKRRRYPCPDCDKTYKSMTDVQDHHNWVHKGTSRHRCEHCNKCFLRRQRLRAHIDKVHLGKKPEKNKICTYCGRGFTHTTILIHHIRTHTGERPHVCEHCGAGFAQKTAMLAHVKTQHGGGRGGMGHGVTKALLTP